MSGTKKRSFEKAFKEDGSEASGFAYAFLKAQNRSMWSELRAKKRALSRFEDLSKRLESGMSLDQALRLRVEELEKKLKNLEENHREEALVPPASKKKVDEEALDAALATCGALLSERAELASRRLEIVEIRTREDDGGWARAAEAREAATAARLAACEEFWRRQRFPPRPREAEEDGEDGRDPSFSRCSRLEEELTRLRSYASSLESQINCRQRLEGDGSTLQAKLVEEIDQTNTALEEMRRQNKLLEAENARLHSAVEVDTALKQKLESSEFVVNEMKNLLTKKRQVIQDHAIAVEDAESKRTKAEMKADIVSRERDAALQKVRALETMMKHQKDAFDSQSADFVERVRAATTRREPPPQLKRTTSSVESSKVDKIDQIRIKTLETKIQCSVCLEREKSVVLTRCYHAFCKECIDTVIATRNRKCPACAKPFGQADVHPVFLVN